MNLPRGTIALKGDNHDDVDVKKRHFIEAATSIGIFYCRKWHDFDHNKVLLTTFGSISSRWFWINCTEAVRSAELNSYGIFHPRGPNLRLSCTMVCRKAVAYSMGFHCGMLVTSSWSWAAKWGKRIILSLQTNIPGQVDRRMVFVNLHNLEVLLSQQGLRAKHAHVPSNLVLLCCKEKNETVLTAGQWYICREPKPFLRHARKPDVQGLP